MTTGGLGGAAGPMLGYLAQVQWALLRSLRLIAVGRHDAIVSIEVDDDFKIEAATPPTTEEATEVWQTKHSIDPTKSLTTLDGDWLKTLYGWFSSDQPDREMTFLTTATAVDDSAPYYLRPGSENTSRAAEKLRSSVESSASTYGKKLNAAIKDLTDPKLIAFLDRVRVVDQTADATEVMHELEKASRPLVGARYAAAAPTYILSWWYRRALAHLLQVAVGDTTGIPLTDLENAIDDLREHLREDDLPVELIEVDGSVDSDDLVFVAQLRRIALSRPRLAACVRDHHRAYHNRRKWERTQLIDSRHLDDYDVLLIEEWMRVFAPVTDGEISEVQTDESTCKIARERFMDLERSDLPRIRERVSHSFIARGSLHMLADELRVGWHPEYISQLKGLLLKDDVVA